MQNMVRAQLRIQQMAFMIIAVFFFFVIVGLFFMMYQYNSIKDDFADLQKEQAVSSLKVIAGMPELACDDSSNAGLCLDKDKVEIMSHKTIYSEFWPVSSVKVYTVYPNIENITVYDSKQKNVRLYSTYVSLCKKYKETDYKYKCEIAKLAVGVKNEA